MGSSVNPLGLTVTQIAQAGNASIANVAGLGGASIAAGIVSMGTSFLVQTGLSLALGAASELFHRKPRLIRRQTIQRNLADPATYLPVIYGTQRVGVNRVFVASTGPVANDYRFLWVIGAICHGPIAGIDEIYLDGKLAVTASGNAQSSSTAANDFSQYVTAWKAYGTEGQLMYHPRANPKVTNATSQKDANNRWVDFTTAHGYLVGDTLSISGTAGVTDGIYFVSDVPSTTRIAIGQPQGGGVSAYSGFTGSADYYNPDLPTELAPYFTSSMKGAGVAYVILRFAYNELRFPNGIPEITVNVRGMTMTDPRSPVTGAITSSATSSGIPRHSAAVVVTTGTAHGLSAGDIVTLAGHTAASGINGTHRIYDVPTTTTFRIPVAFAANGTGGTWAKRAYSTTPALCLREFLQNRIYGVSATAAEIDDTQFGVEATYHETTTNIPVENAPGFSNLRGVNQIVVSAGVATCTTQQVDPPHAVTNHSYSVGMVATFSGMASAAGGAFNNQSFTITAVPTGSTFQFATAVADGTYAGDTNDIVTDRGSDPVTESTTTGRVRAVTPGTLFAAHGTLDPAQSLQRSVEDLLSSCRGILVYQSGQFRLTTPRAATPTSFALTDDTIVGGVTLTCPAQEDAANVVVATFPNIKTSYANDTVSWPPAYEYNDLLAADNGQFLRKEIDLPLTAQRSTAQQIAMITRRESRARMLSCVALESALAVQVGDVVPVTRSLWGFSAKPFRVLTMTPRPDHLVEITLLEHDDSWYNLDPLDDVTYYAPSVIAPYSPPAENVFVRTFKGIGISLPAGVSALDSGLVIGYTLLGGNLCRIDISAHTLRVPTGDYDYVDISYPSGTYSINGSDLTTRNIPWYVYIDDPAFSGTGAYVGSTTQLDVSIGSGRRYLGKITIPSGTSGSGSTGTPYSRTKA